MRLVIVESLDKQRTLQDLLGMGYVVERWDAATHAAHGGAPHPVRAWADALFPRSE